MSADSGAAPVADPCFSGAYLEHGSCPAGAPISGGITEIVDPPHTVPSRSITLHYPHLRQLFRVHITFEVLHLIRTEGLKATVYVCKSCIVVSLSTTDVNFLFIISFLKFFFLHFLLNTFYILTFYFLSLHVIFHFLT